MCTLTWKPLDDGYALFFNRDERRDRPDAHPPAPHMRNGSRCIVPIDPRGGGSWLLVNEFGLTLALLNHYPRARTPMPVAPKSRGELVLAAADCVSIEDAVARIRARPLAAYAPFRWVAADASHAIALVWNGSRLTRRRLPSAGAMLTSSAWRPLATARARHAEFKRLTSGIGEADLRDIDAFHHQRDAVEPARGVLMARADARTHSISCIRMMASEVTFAYEVLSEDANADACGPRQRAITKMIAKECQETRSPSTNQQTERDRFRSQPPGGSNRPSALNRQKRNSS
jgi:hypothetical protein